MKDTILIVDDSIEVITSLSAILKEEYLIKAAKSGEQALKILEKDNSINCILLDLTLPGIDGFTVCEEVQQSDTNRDIPIIMITATIDPNLETRGLLAGAVDFLTKPVNPPIVKARIKSHLFIYHEKQKLKYDYELLSTLHTNLITNAPFGISFLDSSNRVIIWNKFLEEYSGIAHENMSFEKLCNIFPEMREVPINDVNLNDKIQLLKETSIHDEHSDTDRIVRLQLSGFPTNVDNDGMLMVIADITERVKAEEEQNKLREQLIQSQKMEAMGTLAGGIAHDFNNILSVIIGSASLQLQDLNITEELKHNSDDILSAAYRAKDLVGQILSFSRKKETTKDTISITKILEETVSFMKASLPNSVKIKYQNSVDKDSVKANSTELHQVFMNLCTNAFHAMGKDQTVASGIIGIEHTVVTINSIKAKRMHILSGLYHSISISDTGSGIAPDIISKIFDPYFTTKGVGKGTGLGLSVVQGIIADHNGVISLESTLGVGTTFQIYLPVGDELDNSSDSRSVSTRMEGAGERILIVDDEVMLTKIMSKLLSKAGFDTTVENIPSNVIETLVEIPTKYDLIIMDKNMPTMNGYQLARILREKNVEIPFILTTGFIEGRERESGTKKLFNEIIQKPYQTSELIKLIHSLIK